MSATQLMEGDVTRDGSGRAQEWVLSVLSAWLLLAVFVDGWAHFNRPGMETFFTPWHGALYSALAAIGAWVAFVVWRQWRSGTPLRHAVPAGYWGTMAGIAVFSLGGIGDMIWHTVLGIEVALDALVSPTHLLLGAGGLLVLGTGIRSRRTSHGAVTRSWSGAATASLALMTALAAFFLMYVSAFASTAPTTVFIPTIEGTPGHEAAEAPVIAGLAGYLVTTVLLLTPLVYAFTSAGRPVRGLATLIVGTVAWLSVGIMDFPTTAVAGALGATVGAVLADVVLTRVGTVATQRWLPLTASGIAAVVWSGQLIGLALTAGLGWPASLWAGAVVLSAGTAAAVAAAGSSGVCRQA